MYLRRYLTIAVVVMVIVVKVDSSTYTALAGMHKGMNNTRKQTADSAAATQMQGQVDKADTRVEKNEKSAHTNNEVIGTIIDVKA